MSVNTANVFSAASLSEHMYSSLPKESATEIRNPYDAVALVGHACMLAAGFRLLGLGENHKIGAGSDQEASQPLPREWNASTSGDYAFRYAHNQSSMEYLIKISRLGSKVVINGLAIGDEKVHTVDFRVTDYLSESSFPHPLSAESADEGALSVRKAFISAGRMTDAASMLKLTIIQKLAPSLQKEGYEESAHAASQNTASNSQSQPHPTHPTSPPQPHNPIHDNHLPPHAQPRPFHDPLAAAPHRPFPPGDFAPPGFEDEYEINRPPRGGLGDARRPMNIGERDLYPQGLGPHDPLRAGGLAPGGGGMHPTFDDPMFGGTRGDGVGEFGGQIPPGARYDPVGPGGPRFSGGARGGGFGGHGPPNPFGGFGGNDFI